MRIQGKLTAAKRVFFRWAPTASPLAVGFAVYNFWQDAFVWLFGAFGWQWLTDVATVNPLWPAIVAAAGIIALIQTAKSQKLRSRLAPLISVTYDPENCRKTVRYQSGGGPVERHGISIRVCVANENARPAINCEGFLQRVEFRGDGESEFRRQPLYEPHKLPWALDEFTKVTIKKDVPKYLGIIATLERKNYFGFRSDVTSNSTTNRFFDVGEYRFFGSVAADTGGTASFVVGVIWNGKWDEIQTWLVENT